MSKNGYLGLDFWHCLIYWNFNSTILPIIGALISTTYFSWKIYLQLIFINYIYWLHVFDLYKTCLKLLMTNYNCVITQLLSFTYNINCVVIIEFWFSRFYLLLLNLQVYSIGFELCCHMIRGLLLVWLWFMSHITSPRYSGLPKFGDFLVNYLLTRHWKNMLEIPVHKWHSMWMALGMGNLLSNIENPIEGWCVYEINTNRIYNSMLLKWIFCLFCQII